MYHKITATISQVELYLFSILVIGELPLSLVLFPKSNTITLSLTYIIGGEGTADSFGAPEFTPIFSVGFMFLSNVAN
jgi:hypothetical protein